VVWGSPGAKRVRTKKEPKIKRSPEKKMTLIGTGQKNRKKKHVEKKGKSAQIVRFIKGEKTITTRFPTRGENMWAKQTLLSETKTPGKKVTKKKTPNSLTVGGIKNYL